MPPAEAEQDSHGGNRMIYQPLLVDAAAVLRDHGLCRESYLDANGRVCLIGAIRLADDPDVDMCAQYSDNTNVAISHLAQYIRAHGLATDRNRMTGSPAAPW